MTSPALPLIAPARSPGYALPLFALTVTAGLALCIEVGLIGPRTALVAASVLLVGYAAAELAALRASVPPGTAWLVSPVSVATIYALAVGFGATNVLYWLPGYLTSLPSSRAPDFRWLTAATLYATVATIAMWSGFRSGAGIGLGRALWRSPFLARVLHTSSEARWWLVWVCVGLSVGSRVLQVSLGMYGVLGDAETAGGDYRQYLNYAASLGSLSVLVVAIDTFSRPWARVRGTLLGGLVVHEVAWGVLAADKYDTLIPVVMTGLVYYVIHRRLPIRYAAIGGVLLLGSYVVLMPMRKMTEDFDVRKIGEISAVAVDLASAELVSGTPAEGLISNVFHAFLQRINTTSAAAMAMRYRTEHPEDPFPDAFLSNTLMAPVYVLVPRALWPNKPRVQEAGRWFYQTVLGGKSETTLAGISTIGYLNFVGGIGAVVAGFLLLGVLQRGVHDRFLLAPGGARIVVLLGLVGVLGDLPSQYGAIFGQLIRIFPLLLLAQFVIFRPALRRPAAG